VTVVTNTLQAELVEVRTECHRLRIENNELRTQVERLNQVKALQDTNHHLRMLLRNALAHVRGEGDDTLETLIKAALK
jgi:regulator of replication initiation timing